MLGFRRRRKSTFFRRWLLSKREAQRFPAEPSFPANRRDIAPAAIGFLPVGAKGRSFVLSVAPCTQDCNSVQSALSVINLDGGVEILASTADERVANVAFSDDSLSVALMDGRTISVPLAWYPKL